MAVRFGWLAAAIINRRIAMLKTVRVKAALALLVYITWPVVISYIHYIYIYFVFCTYSYLIRHNYKI